MAAFEGFCDSDFDVFAEKKWASNAFNRERLEVKLKLTALGKDLAADLFKRFPGQEMGLTEERPSIFNQHKVQELTLYFLRDEAARRQLEGILDRQTSIAEKVQDPAFHHKHLTLGVRLHQGGIEAGLYLHQHAWVDWKNAQERCKEYFEQGRLQEEIRALPESLKYCRGERLLPACPAARTLTCAAVLGDFGQAGPWTIFGELVDRKEACAAAAGLTERIGRLFETLTALHAFLGWRRDNDYHHLKDALKEQKQKVERKFVEFKPGDEVRIKNGLAAGRIGVIDSLERKGVVKVRLGVVLMSLKMEDLGAIE
jgi:hypothetical protein